jgi:cytochrome c2
VDGYRRSALCVPSLFIPLLVVGLLSACSGKPTPLHTQQDPQLAERGKLLLAQYQCGSCHVIPGVAASRGTVGPDLQAFSRRSYIAGNVPNQPAALVQWIVDPKALIPATTMPSMGASPDDARAMAAYLHTLQ